VYRWIVFLHIASVLGLLLVHPVTVAFHLKEERNDVRIRELLEVSEAASMLRWVFFGITLATGILLGFHGLVLGKLLDWAALVIFVAIAVVMNVYGGRTIDRIADTRDDAEMERLLTRFRPGILAVTGAGGLLLILYLNAVQADAVGVPSDGTASGWGDLLRVLFVAPRVHGLLVGHLLTLGQRVEAIPGHLRAVEEDLAPIRLCDETESSVSDDSLDRAFLPLTFSDRCAVGPVTNLRSDDFRAQIGGFDLTRQVATCIWCHPLGDVYKHSADPTRRTISMSCANEMVNAFEICRGS